MEKMCYKLNNSKNFLKAQWNRATYYMFAEEIGL